MEAISALGVESSILVLPSILVLDDPHSKVISQLQEYIKDVKAR
jgi:hypothetical protein